MRTSREFLNRIGLSALLAACALACPAFLSATAIDSLDAPAGWSTFVDGTATASTSTTAGLSGNALLVTYDLTGGGFIGASRDVTGFNLVAARATGVRFRYRASAPTANTLEFAFIDGDSTDTARCDKLIYKQTLAVDNVWREISLPFVEFKIFRDGDGHFDLDEAARYKWVVTRETGGNGSGSVFLDDLALIRETAYNTGVDFFESATNVRGGTVAGFAGGATGTGSVVYVSSQSRSGNGLEINYSVPGLGFAGVEEPLNGMAFSSGDETIEFWAKGNAGGEPLRVEVNDGTTTVSVPVSNYAALTTAFQKYNIPIGDFSGLNPRGVAAIKLLFTDNAGTGKVYVDDLRIFGESDDEGETVLEDFSKDVPLAPYITAATANDASLAFTTVEDDADGGRVGRMSYSFSGSAGTPFAVIEKIMRPNLLVEPVLRFRFKGTNAANDLEVKIGDADGTEYARKLTAVTNTNGEWKTAALPVDEFAFSKAGADNSLDLRAIKTLVFAVVRKEVKFGTIAFDEIEAAPKIAFEKTGMGSVLTRVATPNNPFSPNGDGIKDRAIFEYSLSAAARVTLRVYDLRGRPVMTTDIGEATAGDWTFEWDGFDDDGRLLPNGVYLFHFEADGVNADRDVYRQVLGVLR